MGVFANALSLAVSRSNPHQSQEKRPGLAEWLLERLRRRALKQPRLMLVERINLAPRQTLALIEADGQRLLVATSPDGAPSFYPLKAVARPAIAHRGRKADSKTECL